MQLQRWMSEAGMTSWVDSIGNVHGRVETRDDDAPAWVSLAATADLRSSSALLLDGMDWRVESRDDDAPAWVSLPWSRLHSCLPTTLQCCPAISRRPPPGSDSDLPFAVLSNMQYMGSHYDTVVDGGKYDGALGIVAGIAAVKALLLDVSAGSRCGSGQTLRWRLAERAA